MPIYMKYDGIDGSVTAKGHEKWIELDSVQLGAHRMITSPTGRGTNREASTPTMSEISVTKHQDGSSAALFKASLWGEGKAVKIDFVKTDHNKFETFLQLELENTLVTNFSLLGQGGTTHDRPTESLAMNFTKITYHTTRMDHKNATGSTDRTMWNLATGTIG